jgi:acyl carrier protein
MKQKFIERFKESLQIDDRDIHMDDEFRKYEEWDSLAYLSLIAMLDEDYDMRLEEADFQELRTVKQVYDAATGA